MKQFQLSKKVNSEKVFILQRSEIEKRLDPFYYVPSLRKLEKQVKLHNPQPLRKHVLSISSGATPKTTEKEKYYSDKENGIPFLRVQNLSPTGVLDTENCKYINRETHENYLKRSQVEGGDLLVKITGVGRMAVASVAPESFIGNTNQHMVVIKTGSKEKSELIAAYLNTDIAESLASRRATGGTRPALDYPSLLSMPIIIDERILKIRKKAVEIKQRKENEAVRLLNSVDEYLLDRLGIVIPKKNNDLENRIFKIFYNDLSGKRFDTHSNELFYKKFYQNLYLGNYPILPFKSKIEYIDTGKGLYNYSDIGSNYLNVNNIDCGEIIIDKKTKKVLNKISNMKESNIVTKGDILTGRVGSIGKFAIYKLEKPSFISDNVFKISVKNVISEFVEIILNSSIIKIQLGQQSKGAVQEVINKTTINSLKLPIPNSTTRQKEIVEYVKNIRSEVKQKRMEIKDALKLAKKEIESLILREL